MMNEVLSFWVTDAEVKELYYSLRKHMLHVMWDNQLINVFIQFFCVGLGLLHEFS
jgi:hypothetical protein